MPRLLLALGLVAIAAALGSGAYRVYSLEVEELDRVSGWRPLSPTIAEPGAPPEPHQELLRARLEPGEEVVFELCSRDGLPADRWAGAVDLVVWHPESAELVLRAPLSEELLEDAQRSEAGACLVFAHAAELREGGVFAVEAVWQGRELADDVTRVPVRARIIAHGGPLGPGDLWLVVLLMAGSVLVCLGATRWGPTPSPPPAEGEGEPRAAPSAARVAASIAAGGGALAAAIIALGMVPVGGALAGLGRGVVLGLVQVGVAVALVSPALVRALGGRRAALALVRPPRARWLLWLSPVFGALLWLAGRLLLALVPATSEAPIESLVSWPSGQLAVSLAGVLVPVAEELFFRGFVYGTVEGRFGRAVAFAVTVLLFAVAHLPQVWGAWGGLAAILVTGVGLTALRAASGSTVAPMVAHVTHNGAIGVLAAALASW